MASDQTAISANASEKWRSNTGRACWVFPQPQRQPELAGKALENQHARHKCFSNMLNKRVENYCYVHGATEGSAKIQQQNNYSCHSSALAQLRRGRRVGGGQEVGSLLDARLVGYVEYFPTSVGANAITFLHTAQISFHFRGKGRKEQHFLVAAIPRPKTLHWEK